MSRIVNISLVNYPPVHSGDPDRFSKTLALMESLIDKAADSKSSLVAFPETCNYLGLEFNCKNAEPLDGPTLQAISQKAQKNEIYVVCPLITKENGKFYNSSVLIGRDGQIAGVYHKNVPTIPEIDDGITPGTTAPVFETDFGRVGLCICFDLNYWEIGSELCKNGAELVIWSSMWPGGRILTKWAIEFGFHIGACCSERSTFVDVAGREILSLSRNIYNAIGPAATPVMTASLDLDMRLLHHDYNVPKLKEVYEKYGSSSIYSEWIPDECLLIFGSKMDNVSSDSLVNEFGLETMREYLAHSRDRRRQAVEMEN